ncbi:hypothetical protein DL93DRAFT_2089851 [Clavulina sp. PMI_390]|nr:hypothetical protein DL93DRAFT_2089851 [Clavulina sp. PMI_390]
MAVAATSAAAAVSTAHGSPASSYTSVDDSIFTLLPTEIIEAVFVALVAFPASPTVSRRQPSSAQFSSHNDAPTLTTTTTTTSFNNTINDADTPYDARYRAKPQLAISAVCRRWRSVALRCPLIWCVIQPNDFKSQFSWTKRCIERTGSMAPLDIRIDWPLALRRRGTAAGPRAVVEQPHHQHEQDQAGAILQHAALDVMRLLLPHAARWRSFSARIAHAGAVASVLQSIAHLASAPRLVTLSVVRLSVSRHTPIAGMLEDTWREDEAEPPPIPASQITAPGAQLPSLARFLRTAMSLRELALWHCLEMLAWPNPHDPMQQEANMMHSQQHFHRHQVQQHQSFFPASLRSLSLASSSLPRIQRQLLSLSSPSPSSTHLSSSSLRAQLTELVLRLGPSSPQHLQNLSLGPLELPHVRRLVLVGPRFSSSRDEWGNHQQQHLFNPAGNFEAAGENKARVLPGALRLPSLRTLEFHACEPRTVEGFLVPSSGGATGFPAQPNPMLGGGFEAELNFQGNAQNQLQQMQIMQMQMFGLHSTDADALKPSHEYLSEVRTLVIVGLVPPSRGPGSGDRYVAADTDAGARAGVPRLANALNAMKGVRKLVIRWDGGGEKMPPQSASGAGGVGPGVGLPGQRRGSITLDVDVSALFLPSSSSTSSHSHSYAHSHLEIEARKRYTSAESSHVLREGSRSRSAMMPTPPPMHPGTPPLMPVHRHTVPAWAGAGVAAVHARRRGSLPPSAPASNYQIPYRAAALPTSSSSLPYAPHSHAMLASPSYQHQPVSPASSSSSSTSGSLLSGGYAGSYGGDDGEEVAVRQPWEYQQYQQHVSHASASKSGMPSWASSPSSASAAPPAAFDKGKTRTIPYPAAAVVAERRPSFSAGASAMVDWEAKLAALRGVDREGGDGYVRAPWF